MGGVYQAGRFAVPVLYEDNHLLAVVKPANMPVMADASGDLDLLTALKQYIELINVVGISFKYTEAGVPVGLCRAKRLYYVTTAGGCYVPEAFGFGYIRDLAQNFYGIREIRLVQAVGLDIDGADVEALLRAAEASLADIAPD